MAKPTPLQTGAANRRRQGLLLLLGPAVCLAAPAGAEEDGVLRSRYEAVVTASRQRTTVFDSERAASAVTRDELRERPPRTTADALNEEEGVFVTRPGYSSGAAYVRGLTGQQVLLVLDGVRLNSTITRAGPGGTLTLIDPYVVESIDVLRGTGSVLYGSDAVGGVIQLRTRRPVPIADSNIELSAGARGAFTSADLGGVGSVSAGGRWGRYAIDGAFSARRFGDLTGGSDAPEQPMTSYREGALYLGGGVDLGQGSVVVVYQGMRQYDALRNGLSQPGDLRQVTEASRDLAYLRYTGRTEGRVPVDVQATVSYQRQGELEDRIQVPLDRIDRLDNQVDMVGVTGSADADLGQGGRLTAGVEGYFEWVHSTAGRAAISQGPRAVFGPGAGLQPRYPGGSTSQSIAAFVQDALDVEKLLGGGSAARPGRLRALVGARLGGNFVGIGADERLVSLGLGPARAGQTAGNATYAGSLHLRWEPLSGLAFLAGGATGFRAPNLSDYARLGPEAVGYLLPTDNLAPELSYSAEAGVRLATRKLEGAASYGFTQIDGVLAATRAGCRLGVAPSCSEYFYVRTNADRAVLHSVEAMARLHIGGGLSVFSVLSYTHGTLERAPQPGDVSRAEPFYKIPPLNGVAAVQLRRPKSVLTFAEVSMRWAAPQERLGQADLDDPRVCQPQTPGCRGTPGFAVFSLRGAAMLTRNVFVTGSVENLANATYRYHGAGVDGPGVGAHLALDLTY